MKPYIVLLTTLVFFFLTSSSFAWRCGQKCPSNILSGKLECEAHNAVCSSRPTNPMPPPPRPTGRKIPSPQERCVSFSPTVHSYTIGNTSHIMIKFYLANGEYTLFPGQIQSFNTKIGREGNSCGRVINHQNPPYAFESSITPNVSNVVRGVIPLDTARKFAFYINNNAIAFGKDLR